MPALRILPICVNGAEYGLRSITKSSQCPPRAAGHEPAYAVPDDHEFGDRSRPVPDERFEQFGKRLAVGRDVQAADVAQGRVRRTLGMTAHLLLVSLPSRPSSRATLPSRPAEESGTPSQWFATPSRKHFLLFRCDCRFDRPTVPD